MTKMIAAQYDAYGPPDVLQLRTSARPVATPGHVLVKVAATSINGADSLVRLGRLRLLSGRRFPRGTGFDFAGEIADVGPGISDFVAGQTVWGFANNLKQPSGPTGSAAEYVLASVAGISPAPHSIDLVSAAALPGVGASALGVLRDTFHLKKGERVLIRGAGGGVGTAAVQIAVALGGKVTALARESHHQRLIELGADQAFDYRTVPLSALKSFDVIIDPVGRRPGDFRRLLSAKGRMGVMAFTGFGQLAYVLATAVFGSRRIRFIESPPTAALLRDLAAMVDAGTIKPIVEAIHPIANIAEAHRAFEAGGGFGKRVIAIPAV